MLRLSSRTLFRSLSSFRPALRSIQSIHVRHFSAGKADKDLVQILSEEFNDENGSFEAKGYPFLESSGFQLTNVNGSCEVKLSKKFGNETVNVVFDVNQMPYSEEASDLSVPLEVVIEKEGGALVCTAVIEEEAFIIEEIRLVKGNVSELDSPEGDWKFAKTYSGPVFEDMDEEVQSRFYEYLEERGIGDDLVKFIPEFAQEKEQSEYVNWLDNVKKFVKK